MADTRGGASGGSGFQTALQTARTSPPAGRETTVHLFTKSLQLSGPTWENFRQFDDRPERSSAIGAFLCAFGSSR